MTRTTTGRLTLLLILSLTVHGVIIALWPSMGTDQLPEAGGHAITVSLLVQAEKQPASQGKPARIKKNNHVIKPKLSQAKPKKPPEPTPAPVKVIPSIKHLAQTKPAPETTSDLKSQTTTSSIEKPVSRSVATQAVTTTNNSQHLEVVLRKAFNAHFYYPRLAIRRGWQGEVRLGLRIEANGHLTRIRILHGSGHGLLDQAAIKSLNKVEVLPEAIALLDGHSLDLILPVKYQLL